MHKLQMYQFNASIVPNYVLNTFLDVRYCTVLVQRERNKSGGSRCKTLSGIILEPLILWSTVVQAEAEGYQAAVSDQP